MSQHNISLDDIDSSYAEFTRKSTRKDFTYQDVLKYVCEKNDAGTEDMERLRNIVQRRLSDDETLFYHDDKAIHRKTFFKGAQFLITPSTFELDRNILFAGDRFAPFCNSDVFHDEYVLFMPGEKESFPIRQINASVQSILPFHIFLGHAGIFDMICAECEENRMRLRQCDRMEQAMVNMSVFDLTKFYSANHFRYRDGILVTVTDWTRCKFSLEYRPHELFSDHHARTQWIINFEDAMLKVCDAFEEYITMPDQIAYAFRFAALDGHNLLQDPIVSAIDYYYNMADITINTDSPDWYLVPAESMHQPGISDSGNHKHAGNSNHDQGHECGGHEHGHECKCGHDNGHERGHECKCGQSNNNDDTAEYDADGNVIVKGLSSDNFSASSGALDSLETILEEINAPFGYVELYSMILDSLANAVDFNAFKSSVIDQIPNGFKDDAQEAAFINFLEENWEVCEETYRPEADAAKIPYRSRLLSLNEQRIDLATRLLTSSNKQRLKDMTPIMRRFYSILIETLGYLNSDSDLPEGEELVEFESRLDDIEEMWDDISADFNNY